MKDEHFTLDNGASLFVTDLPISNDKPGALSLVKKQLANTPTRVKLWWLAGGLGLVSLVLLFLGTVQQKPTTVSGDRARDAFLLSAENPATLAGITPNTPPYEALDKLSNAMPVYERWLSDAQSTHLDELMTIEAQRLYQEAQKEVQSGEIDATDPAKDIDLQSCLTRVLPHQCVLLRYAGDALVKLDAANREGDIYAGVSAYIRYRAALLAMNPPAQEIPDAQLALQGMLNYRIAVYDLLHYLPNSAPVTLQDAVPQGDRQPSDQLHP